MEPVIKATRYHSGDLRVAMFALVQPGTRISFGLCIVVTERLLSFADSLRNRAGLDVRIRGVFECKDNLSLESEGWCNSFGSRYGNNFFFFRWTIMLYYVKIWILLQCTLCMYKLSLFRV